MTAYAARTKNGPPENGRYQVGDTIPDAAGTVWECVRGGFAGGDGMVAGGAQFAANPYSGGVTTFGVGAVNGATVSAVEYGAGSFHHTVLTLADTVVTMVDATVQGGGTKIYDFPAGRILVLGAIASLAPKTTSTIASTVNSGVAGVWALGSAAATADAALTSTEANILPSTAFTTSTTINVAAATVVGALAASAQIDGTTTAVDMYLNACITGATDIDADGTIAWTGTVTVTWINLGDY